MIIKKEKNTYVNRGNTKATLKEEYNTETGEIVFTGKIQLDLSKKTNKKIFYYALVNGGTTIPHFFEKVKYKIEGEEKIEADKKIKERYGVDIEK